MAATGGDAAALPPLLFFDQELLFANVLINQH
jgi:hypothetical protein